MPPQHRVRAMAIDKIVAKEKILTPQYNFGFKYSGPGANRAMKVVSGIIKKTFGIASKDWAVPVFKADVDDDSKRTFFVKYEGEFKILGGDSFSRGKLDITMQGEYSTANGEGNFRMIMIPYLTYKFPYGNFFQKFLYHTWHLMFYNRQKRKYVEFILSKFNEAIEQIKRVYRLEVAEQ